MHIICIVSLIHFFLSWPQNEDKKEEEMPEDGKEEEEGETKKKTKKKKKEKQKVADPHTLDLGALIDALKVLVF